MCACASTSGAQAGARWLALGTSVVLRVSDPCALAGARARVEAELDAIDRACSRFRDDSELSALNARAGRPAAVSRLLLDAVDLAVRAAQMTDGAVDPTIGRALELAGYDRDFSLLPAPRAAPPTIAPERRHVLARACPGWQAVTLDRARSRIRIPRGIRLDLGATAKAWAADRAAAAAAEATGCGVLVGLGGDFGTSGAAPSEGWLIRVTDDHRSDASAAGQTISIRSGGLATSSTAVRRWSHAGRDMHHVIDPTTRAPVGRTWRTVSVAAADCAQANIAATAALVQAGDAPAWLGRLGLPARLVECSGRITLVGAWPEDPDAHRAQESSSPERSP